MTDKLIEQIKADREAGTPGPWAVDFSYQWPSKVRAAPPFNERWICDACAQPSSNDQSHALANACRIARVPDMEARILADAEVIKAAEDHLVKRLKALQTYFDLSDEELESMTSDERADTIRQHRLISEALSSFRQAQAQVEKGEER